PDSNRRTTLAERNACKWAHEECREVVESGWDETPVRHSFDGQRLSPARTTMECNRTVATDEEASVGHANGGWNGSATSPVRLRAYERQQRAVAMRAAGATYGAIGSELGVSPQAAHAAVRRALDRTVAVIAEKADRLRALEAERLEAVGAAH